MNHLYAAADMIEAASIAEVGVDLYVGTMPEDVAKCVMLKDPLYGAEIDDGMRGFFTHSFTVIVRDPDPAAGYERARLISKALDVRRVTQRGLYILRMSPAALPVTYPKGAADQVETSVRIMVAFGELP